MKNLAVFCSGFGSNLQAIINSVKKKELKADITLVISDKVDAYALVRAQKAGIPIRFINPADFRDRESYDRFLVRELRRNKIDLVVLAGFMRIISPYFVRAYRNRILNVHPALLPSFKGTSGIKDALDYGVKVTGVTVHLVNDELDSGPIILQEALKIKDDDDYESLAKRIHRLEHKIFPKAIKLMLGNKIEIKGKNIRIKE